jgi:O-antigen ligase
MHEALIEKRMTSLHGPVAAAAKTDVAKLKSGVILRHAPSLLTGWLALLLLWAPLPFGGVTPWAAALLQVAAFAALVLAAWALESPRDLRRALLPAGALAAVALLGLAQSLPWPASLVDLVSPGHAGIWRQAGELPGVPSPGTPRLSLAPQASRAAALTWAAAAALLLAGAAAGRRRVLRRGLLVALLAGALFQILFGAQQWFAQTRTLWGVEIPVSPRLHGTFVNPNHLALYLEMALPLAFAWGWWASRRARSEGHVERRVLLLAPPALVWLTLFLGLAYSGSRGGLLGAVVGVSAQALALAAVRRRWRTALLGFGTVATGLAVVAAVGLREGLGRILTTSLDDVSWGFRLREYEAVLDLWRQFPILGTGLATFRDAFPGAQSADLQGTWWHGHSDLLELLATTGLVGGVLLIAGFAMVPRRLLRVLAGRGRSEDRAAALALLGVLAAVVVHEMIDSGLTMPANALTLAVLVGAGLAVPLAVPRPAEGGGAVEAAGVDEVEAPEEAPEEAFAREEVKSARRRRKKRR